MTKSQHKHIAILGGTGALGSGLALRWAQAGHHVTLGSRDSERATEVAAKLSQQVSQKITGTSNEKAASDAELVVITVPYASHAATIDSVRDHLTGKVLIDVTVPLKPPKVRTVQLPEGGSVAKALQANLGESVKVVSAFQNVAATHLADLDHNIDCDILVCGNDKEARGQVVELANDAGMKAWHGGRIDNSAVAEALTSLLIFINGNYKIDGAGIRITGTPADS
ncbi:NADPH-dependent F420 reductase [Candidatus Njordibacter sp. Uisw_039]|jgi:NADPH-dependent F420 reductase|uniref:NADPH-dependent F420 reductase n=1 Tax=Candidatus Njordibacter sp. Uisw_039 TaxID=3230972 RepID=UPI0035903489|tara:strand:+ start:4117 stop:4791 length:675 start_codon:yes stop_codon:yes gene_type:complete